MIDRSLNSLLVILTSEMLILINQSLFVCLELVKFLYTISWINSYFLMHNYFFQEERKMEEEVQSGVDCFINSSRCITLSHASLRTLINIGF